MLVHVKRKDLLAAASQTARAAPRATSVEAIRGIHVDADGRRSMLTLTATNFEITIQATLMAAVEQPGSMVIDAALFTTVLSKLPEEDVDLELEKNGRIVIRSGQCQFRMSVLSGDKYPMPELPFPDDTLPVSGLCSLARNTIFAVSDDKAASPQMKCVRLHIGPEGLKASTSNGFCIVEADGDQTCRGQSELLLPAHALKTLAAISRDSDVYEMGLAGKSLVFWNGTLLFSARLVEGHYPDTADILLRFQGTYSVHLEARDLRNAIETVASVAERNARVELAFGEHEIILSTDSYLGRSSASVKALVLNAPSKPLYYNHKKLLEYLNLTKGKITLEFDASGLLAIRTGSIRYLQSPMRPPTKTAAGKAA